MRSERQERQDRQGGLISYQLSVISYQLSVIKLNWSLLTDLYLILFSPSPIPNMPELPKSV